MFSSCSSKYYYTQLASPNKEMSRKANGDFVYENDSLWIAYMFGGENAPVILSIGNKLDKPLYIDWNKSYLLVGDQRYRYIETKQAFSLQNLDSLETENMVEYPSVLAGSKLNTILPDGIEYIPANYVGSGVLAWINPDVIGYQQNKKYEKHKIANKKGIWKNAKRLNFEESDSPLKFSSVISYYYGNPISRQSFYSDFYVKNVIQTSISPADINPGLTGRGDIFFTHIQPDYSAAQVIGATAITMGLIVVDAVVSSPNY